MTKPMFVVICLPRTGSTLLANSLHEHPELQVAGEVLNPGLRVECNGDFVGWRNDCFRRIYGLTQQEMKDGNKLHAQYDLGLFFEELYFNSDFNGCKILFHHAPPDSSVWKFFSEHPEVKRLFLHRNMVESALSWNLAIDNGVWHLPKGAVPPEDDPLEIKPDYFEAYHRNLCVHQLDVYDKLKGQCLDIQYNDMCQKWEETMRLVQDYIGVPYHPVEMELDKRTTKSPVRLIKNYESLASHFKGTIWEEHFNHKLMI